MRVQAYNLIVPASQKQLLYPSYIGALSSSVWSDLALSISTPIGAPTNLANDMRLTSLSERTITYPDSKKREDGV